MTKFEIARKKYQPENIKYLLVAETPPRINSDRFFYFEDVNKQDSLFLEIIKCLYPIETKDVSIPLIRRNKKAFLEKFQKDCFYLIDSLDMPFEKKLTTKQKEFSIKQGQSDLLDKVKKLCNDQTKVILIAAPVFRANYSFLVNNKVNIINHEFINFPGSGGQKRFREKFDTLLKDNR